MEYRGNRCQVCTGCGRCRPGGRLESEIQVVTAVLQLPRLQPGRELAVADLGTTTIAMEWYDGGGVKRGEYVCPNPQRVFGADVISRIQAAENPMLRRQLQLAARQALAEGLTHFRQQGGAPTGLTVAGNTTMTYLLTGHDPTPLGAAPFTAAYLAEETLTIGNTETVTLPGLSAFVGGDIAAGIVACGLDQKQEPTLLVDLGTNGELALGCRDRIICCSTAAGPAFEGGSDIWGADMTALTARLLELGLVDETGLLAEPWFEQGITIGNTRITQGQIRQLQMAKAAICAGIRVLAEVYGLTGLEQIQEVYLAGGFGYFLDVEAAIALGLLPAELSGRVRAAGNTALAGAWLYAADQGIPGRMAELRQMAQVINLAAQPDFETEYIGQMNLRRSTAVRNTA